MIHDHLMYKLISWFYFYYFQDQYGYASIAHQQQPQQPQSIGTNRIAHNMRNSVSSITINQATINANGMTNYHMFFFVNKIVTLIDVLILCLFIVLHSLPNNVSIGAEAQAQLLQNQINAVQQQKMLHNALTRTTSHQPTNSELQLLQSTLESISTSDCHRKLERTQSEPAPQVNGNSQVNSSR